MAMKTEATREMAHGGLSHGHSSIGPQPALCARRSPLGVLLPPLSGVSPAQDDLSVPYVPWHLLSEYSEDTLERVKLLGHAFSLLMQQKMGLSPLGGIRSP